MEFSKVTVCSAAVAEEWAVSFPWIQAAILFLQRLRILSLHSYEVERVPSGWWEWILSWFGYSFQETIREYHLDILVLFLILLGSVVSVTFLLALVRGLFLLGQTIILWFCGRVLQLFINMRDGITHIFRVLASSLDPGKTFNVVIPNKSVLAYNTESIRTGSVLTKYCAPGMQVSLGILEGVKFVAHGCGVRVDVESIQTPFIITPGHVYDGLPDTFTLYGKTGCVVIDKKSLLIGSSPVERKRYVLDTDVIAFPISTIEASKAGVSKSTIGNTVSNPGVMACIVGPSGEGSLGTLQADANVFGWLIYSGSTVAGFSGAAYVVGNSVVAFHMLGGSRNMGYSLRLAYLTLKYYLRVKPEDTYEWLQTFITKKRGKIILDKTWPESDSVRVKVRGEYHIVDKETWQDAIGKLTISELGSVEYDDASVVPQSAVPESKNSVLTAMAGSSSSTDSSPEAVLRLQKKVASQRKHLNQLQELLNKAGTSQKRNSAGQEGTQIPSAPPESI